MRTGPLLERRCVMLANDSVSDSKQTIGVAYLGSKVCDTPRNEVTARQGESDATVVGPVAD
jgi:hypothetical protein